MLQKVKRGVAEVVTAKKRLQMQTDRLEQSVVKLDGQARQALSGGREDLARTALERKVLIQGQLQDLDQQIAGLEAQQATLVQQERTLSAEGRGLPHAEGGDQGPVLGRRGAGADRRGDHRAVAGAVRRRRGGTARAHDKTEQMRARAAAVEELVETGALDDLSAPGTSELDRQIAALSADSPGRERDGPAAGRDRGTARRRPS